MVSEWETKLAWSVVRFMAFAGSSYLFSRFILTRWLRRRQEELKEHDARRRLGGE